MITEGMPHRKSWRHEMLSRDYVTRHMITWEPHDSFSAEGSVQDTIYVAVLFHRFLDSVWVRKYTEYVTER